MWFRDDEGNYRDAAGVLKMHHTHWYCAQTERCSKCDRKPWWEGMDQPCG